jgi:hypothetical protein
MISWLSTSDASEGFLPPMSAYKVNQSRQRWKQKATSRADDNRYLVSVDFLSERTFL